MADASEPQPDPDVDDEGEKTKKRGKSKKGSFPKRYIVAIMIFLGICVQYALRVNLSVAIGAMCNNHTIEQNGFTIKKVGVPAEGGYSTKFYTGDGLNFEFVLLGSVPRSEHLTICITFLTEKVTLSYTFQRKWQPFHIPTVGTLRLFSDGLLEMF